MKHWQQILKAYDTLIDRRHEMEWAEAGKRSSKHGTVPKSRKTIDSARRRLKSAGVRFLRLIGAPINAETVRRVTDLDSAE